MTRFSYRVFVGDQEDETVLSRDEEVAIGDVVPFGDGRAIVDAIDDDGRSAWGIVSKPAEADSSTMISRKLRCRLAVDRRPKPS